MAAKCSSCGAEIIWSETVNGKKMPLSVASKERRFVLGVDGKARTLETYQSHFADCPNAAQHRKTKEPGRKNDE